VTKANDLKQKVLKETLAEWRQKHINEWEKNLEVARSIRDDPQASNRDKNEAIKIISRMLGILQPEKQTTKEKKEKAEKKEPELTPEEEKYLEELLGKESG